jgi:hypothetical protein
MTVEGGWEDNEGGGSLRPTHPVQSQTPSMLSIFGWMINPASCLGGGGPSQASSSSMTISMTPCRHRHHLHPLLLSLSLTAPSSGTVPQMTKTTKMTTRARRRRCGVRVPWSPASLRAFSRRPARSPPPPLLPLSSSYANALDYDDNLARDGRAASRQRRSVEHSTDATEALAFLLRPGPTAS